MINTECGIFGIISKTSINSQLCIKGLTKQQHRGRESFGVSYHLKDKIYVEKRMGLVSQILEDTFSKCWLGHVRYSTSGGGKEGRFIQPQVCSNIMETFALAHNGNIPDYIWRKLISNHPKLSLNLEDNNDTLLFIKYIEYLVNNNIANNWKDIIINIVNNIDAAYSIVIQTIHHTYLFRDNNAFKPLVYSKYDNKIFISSESSTFKLDSPFNDVNLGEILQINNNTLDTSILYKMDLMEKEITHCAFEYLYFLRDNNKINSIDVKDFRIQIGKKLAMQISKSRTNLIKGWKDAIICGVPNSGICFAKSFSDALNIEYRQFLELNDDYSYRSFILKTDRERLEACRRKFKLNSDCIRGRIIILVDDSIVRGNTLSYLIKYISESNPKEIHFISGSPPIKYPCHYGIDFPDIEELIVNKIEPSNLADYYGIDSLTYLDINNLDNDNMCKACFTGNYPI